MTKDEALARVRHGGDGGSVELAVMIALEHGNSQQDVAAQLDMDEDELMERYPLFVKNAGKVGSIRHYRDPPTIVDLDQD